MMRKTTSKKIQNTGTSVKNVQSQKLFLAKNYLEQQLETQGYRGHVRYDRTNKALIQYRVQEGTVAILKEGRLCIFEMPMKKFRGALPLEVQSVDMDSIQTQKATYCKRCHTWRQQADITRCMCGGDLVPRKRFSVDTVESWDEEFLEIQFARKDIAAAIKTDRILSRKAKQYHTTGITRKLAGMSSVVPEKPVVKIVTRISQTGKTWLEKLDNSTLAESVTIKKMDGFTIPPTDDVQNSIKEQLYRKFSCEVDT